MPSGHLFVYGTLRRAVGHAMHGVLVSHAAFVSEATVVGALYSLGRYPGLVPGGEAADLVHGEVYTIMPDALERTLAVLDDYEGIGPAHPPPCEYRREVLPVVLPDGRALDAWAYVLNRPTMGLIRIGANGVADWLDDTGLVRAVPRTRRAMV